MAKDLFRDDPRYRAQGIAAAHAHAKANNSDPFAYGRMVKDIRLGLALASEVQADADHVLEAREKAKLAALKERERSK